MRHFLTLVLLSLFFFSCTKQNPDVQPVSTAWGELEASIVRDSFNGDFQMVSGVFYDLAGNRIPVGSVFINYWHVPYDTLADTNSYHMQTDSSLPTFMLDSTAGWHVGGTGDIPEFFYTDASPFPVMTMGVPDSIDKTVPFTLNINSAGFSGTDTVYVQMDIDAAQYTSLIPVSTGGAFTVTAAQLSAPSIYDYHYIQIVAKHYVHATLGINSYTFVKSRRLVKLIKFY